ncbi:hypothetical protein [Polyangium sp. y55x31]|uniref:hypothetical protein n=1 Tax=Polyangium sp. y55x31 TaxID=3042688 RepID=UPI002482BA44|nr:hypothetical protein [Polyangium sp. y55x31]MDI1479231.1 hypothetical protein [Polyangium sp. y55x31]
MLAPLDPRLRGPLGDEEEPEGFIACIELDVACDGRTLLDLLVQHGYRAERLTGGPAAVFVVEAIEPIEITLRRGDDAPLDDEPACDAVVLAKRMRSWHPGSQTYIDGVTCVDDLLGQEKRDTFTKDTTRR